LTLDLIYHLTGVPTMSSIVSRRFALLVFTLLGPICFAQVLDVPNGEQKKAFDSWFQNPENLKPFNQSQPGINLTSSLWPETKKIVLNGQVKDPANWSEEKQKAAEQAMKELGNEVKTKQLVQVVGNVDIEVVVNLAWEKPSPVNSEPIPTTDPQMTPIPTSKEINSGSPSTSYLPNCPHCQALQSSHSPVMYSRPLTSGYREPLAPNNMSAGYVDPREPILTAPMFSNGPIPVNYSTTGPNPANFYGSNPAWWYSPKHGSPIWNRFNRGSY
jgi:hypothetical protein